MKGIEYVCRIFNLKFKDLAELLKVSPSNVNHWAKGNRKIPEERLDQLEENFNIPKAYFEKELNQLEVLEIELVYLNKINSEEATTLYKKKCLMREQKSMLKQHRLFFHMRWKYIY